MRIVRSFTRKCSNFLAAKNRVGKCGLASLLLSALVGNVTAQEGGTFSFTAPTYLATPGDGTAIITVTRDREWAPVSVDLIIADGSAVAGTNYEVDAQTNTLIFTNFQTSVSFPITLSPFTEQNTNKMMDVKLTLQNPQAITNTFLTLVPDIDVAEAALEIYADTRTNFINIERTTYLVQEGGEVEIKFVMANAPGDSEEIQLTYEVFSDTGLITKAGSDHATAGSDFEGRRETIIWPPDETEVTITIPIFSDSEVEFNEDFYVGIVDVTGAIVVPIEPPTDGGADGGLDGGLDGGVDGGVDGGGGATEERFEIDPGDINIATVTILFNGSDSHPQPAGANNASFNRDNSAGTDPQNNRAPGANRTVYDSQVMIDGRTVIGGQFTSVNAKQKGRVARLLPNGQVDPDFRGFPGANDFVWTVAVYDRLGGGNDPDAGKVLIGGGFTSVDGQQRNGIARLNEDGTLDTSFNPGFGMDGPVYAIELQPDGRILVGGDFTLFNEIPVGGMIRLLPNGQLDATFEPGIVNGPVFAISAEEGLSSSIEESFVDRDPVTFSRTIDTGGAQGVLSLTYNFFEGMNDLRILQGNTVVFDTGLINTPMTVITNQDFTTTTNFFSTNAIVTWNGGRFLEFVVNSSGTNEARNWEFSAVISPATIEGVLVGGEFTSYNGAQVGHIVRLNNNGEVDDDFVQQTGIGADGTVYAIGRQSDGDVILGGAFQTFNSFPAGGVARLSAEGEFDRDFGVYEGTGGTVFDVAVQPNDRIVAVGNFLEFHYVRRVFVTRLLEDGAVDTSFMDPAYNQYAGFVSTNYGFPEGYVQTVSAAPNGGVFVGGSFRNVGGGSGRTAVHPRINFAMLHGGATPGPGNLNFLSDTFGGDENSGVLALEIERINGSLGSSGVGVITDDGAAVDGVDYTGGFFTGVWGLQGSRQILGEVSDKSVIIELIDDEEIEGDEDFNNEMLFPVGVLALGGEYIPTYPALGPIKKAKGIILENDVESSYVLFSSDRYDFNENDGTVTIEVQRVGNISSSASVQYRTATAPPEFPQATVNADYFNASGNINFAAGRTNQTITLRLRDDFTVEPDEFLTIQLFAPIEVSLGTNSFGLPVALVNIIDNDFQPGHAVFSTETNSAPEGGVVRFGVRRVGGNVGVLQVKYTTEDQTAVAGADYNQTTGTLVWDHLQSHEQFIEIPILQNALVDGPRTFTVRLFDAQPSDGTGVQPRATGVIQDDDAFGTFQFLAPEILADENGTNVIVNVVRLSGSAQEAEVDFSTMDLENSQAGRDYFATNGTLVFGPGETSKSFAVRLINNTNVATAEVQVGLTLTNTFPEGAELGAIAEAHIAVMDDEAVNIPAGSVETDFNTGAGANDRVHVVAVEQVPDGRILIGGEFQLLNRQARTYLARLDAEGNLDTKFGIDYEFNGPIRAIDIQPDGRVLVGGMFTENAGLPFAHVARLGSSGSIDTTFNVGSGASGNVYALKGVTHGGQRKFYIGGEFSFYNGIARRGIARVNFNGRTDPTFNPGTGVNGPVYAIALQDDGKILIGGAFTEVNGLTRVNLARLNEDGSVDIEFVPPALVGEVRALLVQYDNRIVIGGQFTSVGEAATARIARLNSDGSIDPTFDVGPGANSTVATLALQLDGKILAGGDFTMVNGLPANRIVRLNVDGSIDPSINFGVGANAFVRSLAIQVDRRIIAGGDFTNFNGFPRNHYVRLYGGSISGQGELEFVQPQYNVSEAATNVVVAVRRHGGLSGSVSVDYRTIAGTATPESDYIERSGTLIFQQGENYKTFNVPILDDSIVEPLETVHLALTNALGTGPLPLQRQPVSLISIQSDDSVIEFSQASYSVSENAPGGNAVVTITRVGHASQTVSVRVRTMAGTATQGQDYGQVAATVTFGPNDTQRTVAVPILNDSTIELDETLSLQLEFVTPPPATITIGRASTLLTIQDDDFFPGRFSVPAALNVREDQSSVDITVTRSSGRTGIVSVQYRLVGMEAIAGEDYVQTQGTLIFEENVTSAVITVPILNDLAIEIPERFRIELAAPTGGASIIPGGGIGIVTIQDDDVGPGSVDENFQIGEGANGPIHDLHLQADGKVVIAGAFTAFNGSAFSGAARLLPNGSVDPDYVPGGAVDGTVYDISALGNGVAALGGELTMRLGNATRRNAGKLLTNGSPDLTFTRSANENGPIYAVAARLNGKVVIGGDFTNPASRIAQLNADGSLDPAFNPDTGLDGPVYALDLDASGRVLVGGNFTRVGVVGWRSIARLLPSGLVDSSFNGIGSGANGPVVAVRAQPDGTALIGGDFTAINGIPRSRAARLLANGSVDPAFNPPSINGEVRAIAEHNGRIYIAGNFTSVDGQTRNRVARLNSDGSLDTGFDVGLGPNGVVHALEVQPDGDVLIAGDFTQVAGETKSGIARLKGAPMLPIEITEVRLSAAGQFEITFSSVAGAEYVVDASTDLQTWAPVATVIASGAVTTVSDSDTTPAYKFYRVRRVEQ